MVVSSDSPIMYINKLGGCRVLNTPVFFSQSPLQARIICTIGENQVLFLIDFRKLCIALVFLLNCSPTFANPILEFSSQSEPLCLVGQSSTQNNGRVWAQYRDGVTSDQTYLAVKWYRKDDKCSYSLVFVREHYNELLLDRNYTILGNKAGNYSVITEVNNSVITEQESDFHLVPVPLGFYLDTIAFADLFVEKLQKLNDTIEDRQAFAQKIAYSLFGMTLERLRIQVLGYGTYGATDKDYPGGQGLIAQYSFNNGTTVAQAMNWISSHNFSTLAPFDYKPEPTSGSVEKAIRSTNSTSGLSINELLQHSCVTSAADVKNGINTIESICSEKPEVRLYADKPSKPVLSITGKYNNDVFWGRIVFDDPGYSQTKYQNALRKFNDTSQLTPMQLQQRAIESRSSMSNLLSGSKNTVKTPPSSSSTIPKKQWPDHYLSGSSVIVTADLLNGRANMIHYSREQTITRKQSVDTRSELYSEELYDRFERLIATIRYKDGSPVEFDLYQYSPFFDVPLVRKFSGSLGSQSVDFGASANIPFVYSHGGTTLKWDGESFVTRMQGATFTFKAYTDWFTNKSPTLIASPNLAILDANGYLAEVHLHTDLAERWMCVTSVKEIKSKKRHWAKVDHSVENCVLSASVKKDGWYYFEKPFRSLESAACSFITATANVDNCSVNIPAIVSFNISNPFTDVPPSIRHFTDMPLDTSNEGNLLDASEFYYTSPSFFSHTFTENGYFDLSGSANTQLDSFYASHLTFGELNQIDDDINDHQNSNESPMEELLLPTQKQAVTLNNTWHRATYLDFVELLPSGKIAQQNVNWPGSGGHYGFLTNKMAMRDDVGGNHWAGASRKRKHGRGYHLGTDIATVPGEPIYSPVSGRITTIFPITYVTAGPFIKKVKTDMVGVIVERDGWQSRILYLDEMSVLNNGLKLSDEVNVGQLLGNAGIIWEIPNYVGIPNHIHWELRTPENDSFNPFCGLLIHGKKFTKEAPWHRRSGNCQVIAH